MKRKELSKLIREPEWNSERFTTLMSEIDSIRTKIVGKRRDFPLDPLLREIEDKYVKLNPVVSLTHLACPKCGVGNSNSTLNGRPWCFKCNTALKIKE